MMVEGSKEVKEKILALLDEKEEVSGPTISQNICECFRVNNRAVMNMLKELVREGEVASRTKKGEVFPVFSRKKP